MIKWLAQTTIFIILLLIVAVAAIHISFYALMALAVFWSVYVLFKKDEPNG